MRKLSTVVALLVLSACSDKAAVNPARVPEPPAKPEAAKSKPSPPPVEVVAVFAQPKVQQLSCDLVGTIIKSRIDEGKTVGPELLLAQGGCDQRTKDNNPKGVVVAVPKEDGTYFYNTISKGAASTATDICHAGAIVGATMIAAGEENISVLLYGPGGRACDELLDMAINDNPMLIINPVGAVGVNEMQRIGAKGLKTLHLYDNYQDATADLERAAKTLHASVNKDIEQVKDWVGEDPARAAVYASNPMIGPIYEDRKRIGREIERIPKNVGDVGSKVNRCRKNRHDCF